VGGSLTTNEEYTNGWFRNNNTNTGLYNQAAANHFYANDAGWWSLAGTNGSWCGIRLRPQGHQSTVRGCIYADTSNNVGFLNYGEGWTLRVNGNVAYADGFQVNSDARIKDNIVDSKYGLADVLKLRSVEYDKKTNGTHEVGLIAQEVEQVMPEFVTTSIIPATEGAAAINGADEISDLKSVNYAQMVSVLIKAVQELSAEVTELKKQLGK
jgi:hypothetical protein